MAATCRAAFQDYFTNRETITNISGQITGNNSNATVEVGEPQTGGKPGGHSVWISWIAPANGVATFRTDGSTFDTLLGAYYLGSTNDTTVDKLHLAAQNDDAPGLGHASLIQFGALAGQHYEIAVDGYRGAVGAILLNWSFVNASSPPPVILSTPADRALRIGDPVTLSVNMQTSSQLQLKWELNEEDTDQTGTNFVITSMQATNVGRYTLRISIGSVRFETDPTELQINSEGLTNVLAQDKILDSPGSDLVGEDGDGPGPVMVPGLRRPRPVGVVRGYNGSQVFDTTYATTDPSEPLHCGVVGGASYWLQYLPPTNGTITLDTIGSTYDTVMEAYTYNGALNSYADLISMACNNDATVAQGPSRLQFPVFKGRPYLIVVDGVNGARGIAWLNYSLDTNHPPVAPKLMFPVVPIAVNAGLTVTLAPALQASPPAAFSWSKDGTPLPGATSGSITLTNVIPTQSGNYVLTVTNDLGVLVTTQALQVVVSAACSVSRSAAGITMTWPTVAGQRYTLEEALSPAGPWQSGTNSFLGDGHTASLDIPAVDARFYRLRIE